MKIANLSRWLIAGALACAAVAMQSANVKAEKRLYIGGIPANVNCQPAPNTFFMEAWGYAPNIFVPGTSVRVCEAYTSGGTGLTTCPNSATFHKSAVTKRNESTLAWAGLIQTSADSVGWVSQSPQMNTVTTGANGCTQSIFSGSQGFDFPFAAEP